ncbi:hypothetical protein M409DRAFT_56631 [Zasmidium cellare ATCC 36951]|uniref:AB hydrolase-1 domain-containing protein n=1 Tax=Zasmidium cellare ATCC 36951 TaxID=1080233 RepID=A0A6A6CBD1_ZASCE|nr:uncharacterized protein M409DRAFT_56631 [Zasmidium cellare ATCC 36951]KAF2164355.1 hypothetical protein M409DRAFT_56631 [Zasmidium cellare ATCC 36951]
MPFKPTYATIQSENCSLHYWHQGTSSQPLLILISGGNGVGKKYNGLFEHLSDKFHVCTYDRRQNGASQLVEGKMNFLNAAQQARDVVAIMQDLGYGEMCVFGNSGGAVIGFTLAVNYPQYLTHIICHEAPTIALLPDAADVTDWCSSASKAYREQGPEAAWSIFKGVMTGYEGLSAEDKPSLDDLINFWENEFIVFSTWCPDLTRIKANNTSIAVALGDASKDAYYARTVQSQGEILHCPQYALPGPHTGFVHFPEEFARDLKRAFGEMESRKGSGKI